MWSLGLKAGLARAKQAPSLLDYLLIPETTFSFDLVLPLFYPESYLLDPVPRTLFLSHKEVACLLL